MAAIAAAIAGTAISAAATVGATVGTAKAQTAQAQQSQTSQQNFQESIIDRGLQSYRDAGLPDFAYWSQGQYNGPNTLTSLGGSNFYEGSGVNANLPYFTSPWTQYMHTGKPLPQEQQQTQGKVRNTGTTLRTTSQGAPNVPVTTGESNPGPSQLNSQTGQTDRLGLGNGRYNAVPPPTLTYNSVGVGTSYGARNVAAQATTSMRDRTVQTPMYINGNLSGTKYADPSRTTFFPIL